LSKFSSSVKEVLEEPNITKLARKKCAQLVGIDKEKIDQVIFARNTTDAIKIAYRLSNIEQNNEIIF